MASFGGPVTADDAMAAERPAHQDGWEADPDFWDPPDMELLRAAPHRWGKGAVHIIDQQRDDRTLCGQRPSTCPGERFWGDKVNVTCGGCLRSLEATARSLEVKKELEEYERQRQLHNEQWWLSYNKYLTSAEWREKHHLVMRRAAGICEHCLKQAAVQVHHESYPRDCLAGSDEWRRQEAAWTLRAICLDCHKRVHQGGEHA